MRATTSSRTTHPQAPPGLLRELSRLRAENQRLTRRTAALESQCTRLESLVARYKELWHGAFEGVVIHDKGVVIDANPAYAKLFGRTVAEMLGSSVYDHLDPRVHGSARERIRRNAVYRAQITGKHKDGSLIPMEYHARPIEVDGRKVRIVAVRDISHLVQQQEALAASEERFRNLVEGSIQGILVHRGGKPLFANRALARMFGYPSAGAVARLPSVKALMTPKAWDFVYGHESRRARGLRAPDRYEFEGRHKKGHALWLDSSSRVVMWDGKPAIQSTWIDITERRRRESDRIAHERLLQTVMDTIPHSVFVKDAQGRYLMVNQAMATMWRRSPHAFIGRTSSQVGVFSEPLLRDIQRWDRHVLRTGKPQPPTEISIPTATQDRRFDMVRYPVRDNTGRVTGLVALSQNVTERRRAEQALRESELRFRTLVEVSIQGIAVYRGRRAVFSNAAYARLAGYASPEEILALDSFERITHPEEVPRLVQFLTAVVQGRAEHPAIEFRGIRKDGRMVWVNAVVTPVLWDQLPCILIAMIDITERKQAAENLRQSEERFRNLVEGSIQGTVIHRNYHPLFANQAVADLYGYGSADEIMRLPNLDVLNAPEEREGARQAHQDRLRGHGAPARYELQGMRRDGTRIWVEALARVVTWDGEPAVQYTIIDVTERKQSEAAVRANQRLLQAVFDSIPMCLFTKDRAGRIVVANRAQCEFDGLTPDRITGLGTREYPNRTPVQIAENLAWDRRVIEDGEQVDLPAYTRPDARGRERWLRGLRLPLRDDNGRIVGQLAMNEDITERREAELAVRASQRLLQTVFDTIPLRLTIKDAANRYVLVNRAMAENYGTTPEAFVGRKPNELPFLSADEKAGFVDEDQKVLTSGQPLIVPELTVRIQSGASEVRRLIKMPVYDDLGLVTGVLGVIENISERKAAEQQREELLANLRRANDQLVSNQRLLRTIFDTIPHRLAVNDADSRYLMVNLAMAKRFGHAEREFVGQTPRDLEFLTANEQNQQLRSILSVLETGAAFEISEGRSLLSDGKEELIRFLCVPVRDGNGRTVGTVSVTEDISEWRRADQVRAELMEGLRRANDDLRDFAYIVSHDLKAPLRGISSLAEWLMQDYADRLGDEGRENLTLLRARTRRMAMLLEGILTYSRIGRLPTAIMPVDVEEVVRGVIDTLNPPGNIQVQVEHPLPVVTFDAVQLSQVFQNLIGNAIQHLGKPSGTVRVSAHKENGHWRFDIADDGIGIEPRHFDRIFKIFQRVKADQESGGTGLGLSVVKKIVESRGGEVWVGSEPGKGSVFSFTIKEAQG